MLFYHAAMTYEAFKKYYELFPNKKLNILQSYADLKKIDKFIDRRNDINSIILDSGTFTMNHSDLDIDIDDYKNYLLKNGHLFDLYFNFDEDFTEEGGPTNFMNQIELEQAGLSPVPVIKDIYEELEHIRDMGYSYIALASPQLETYEDVKLAMSKVENTGIKIHLLGEIDYKTLANLPINSVDASSWTQTGAYGDLLFWNPKGETDRIYLEERLTFDDNNRNKYSTYKYKKELDIFLKDNFRISYEDFLKPKVGDFYKSLVNLHYFVKFEEKVDEEHRKKGFNTDTTM